MGVRQVNFSPGPSQLYPGVGRWLAESLENNIASMSHRSAAYVEIHKNTVQQLRILMNVPDNYQIFFLSSATEAMERTIQNCVKTYSHHFVNGVFSNRFYEISSALGKKATKTEAPHGKGFKPADIKVPARAELIGIAHNETSTGVSMPAETINSIKAKYPDKLLVVDAVSSAPLGGIELKNVDVLFFSVQKCFGLPAGLGVIIVSPKAMAKAANLAKSGQTIGSYHSFPNLEKFSKKHHTPDTPNVLGIYLLGKVAEVMNKKGYEGLIKLANQKYQALDKMIDSHTGLGHFVDEPEYRSVSVITIETNGSSSRFIDSLHEKGLNVGGGYGPEYKYVQLRIANFPATTYDDFLRLVDEISGIK